MDVDGPNLPAAATGHVVVILARIADPAAFIDAATGRTAPGTVLPFMR